jgi:hypothetical protein
VKVKKITSSWKEKVNSMKVKCISVFSLPIQLRYSGSTDSIQELIILQADKLVGTV